MNSYVLRLVLEGLCSCHSVEELEEGEQIIRNLIRFAGLSSVNAEALVEGAFYLKHLRKAAPAAAQEEQYLQ